MLLCSYLIEAFNDAGIGFVVDPDGPKVAHYEANWLMLDEHGKRVLSVKHGGSNHPHVECKNERSAVVASVLRRHFDHLPTRLDSAYDLTSPSAFLDLYRIALQFEAKGWDLFQSGGRVEHPTHGTTLYLGSRKSERMIRIYQRGLKIAKELGLTASDIPESLRHYVRIELEFKPDKRLARELAATLSPAQIWGGSPRTRAFVKQALSIDAEPVKMNFKREPSQERAMRFLAKQYGPAIVRQVELLGSWDRFMIDLQERLGLLDIDEAA